MNERKYVAISIKHSEYSNSKTPVLWGHKRTQDDEDRCFGGYTDRIDKCELYSLEDFQKAYGHSHIVKCDEPVKMCFDYKKKYKNFDTVLVEESDLRNYLSML